jgi:ABC-type multidrug transport system ATPase subunit
VALIEPRLDDAPAAPPGPAAGGAPVVALTGVHRSFGGNPALVDLDLAVARGSITVLLGPNGAGKTTAIRMITGALSPDAGQVRTFGLDPDADGEAIRRRCGVVSAKPALYDRLSGFDNLLYSAELYGLGRGDATRQAIEAAAARFGIEHALAQHVGGYSTGMKTRLALARSVLHEPDLFLFDEPTSGLDPESSVAVLDLIRTMTGSGATVVMCTHLLLEAEGLADQVVVLDGGTDLVSGTPQDLSRRYWPHATVRIDGADRPAIAATLRAAEGVLGVDLGTDGDGPVSIAVDDHARIPDLVFRLAAAGVRVSRVEPYEPSLEDLYFAVRGRARPTGAAVPRDTTPLAADRVTSGNRIGRRFSDPFAAEGSDS